MSTEHPAIEAVLAENAELRARVASLEQRERERGEAASQAQRINDLLPNILFVVDLVQGRNIYVNQQMARMLQYTAEEAVAMGDAMLPMLMHPEDLARAPAHLEALRALADGEESEIEYRMRRRDGSWRWLRNREVVLSRDPDGGARLVLGTIQDITEQRDAEAKLRQKAAELERFKALVDNALDGIVVLDRRGEIQYCNDAFAAMVGAGERRTGASIGEWMPASERGHAVEDVLSVLFREGSWRGRLSMRRPGGVGWKAQVSAFVLDPAADAGPAIAAIFRDMTAELRAEDERAALQAQLIEAQASALVELGTPLIPIAEGVLAMPLVGAIDAARAQQILEVLLQGIVAQRAGVAILDITGVKGADAGVSEAVTRAARAARLLGAEVVLTGISPDVAQILVASQSDLGGIVTRGSFQSGIAYALGQRGRGRPAR